MDIKYVKGFWDDIVTVLITILPLYFFWHRQHTDKIIFSALGILNFIDEYWHSDDVASVKSESLYFILGQSRLQDERAADTYHLFKTYAALKILEGEYGFAWDNRTADITPITSRMELLYRTYITNQREDETETDDDAEVE